MIGRQISQNARALPRRALVNANFAIGFRLAVGAFRTTPQVVVAQRSNDPINHAPLARIDIDWHARLNSSELTNVGYLRRPSCTICQSSKLLI